MKDKRATIVASAQRRVLKGSPASCLAGDRGVIMRKMFLCAGLMSLVLVAGCVASFNQNEQARRQDFDNCSVFGTPPKSTALAECMALQRQRRELAIQRQNDITAANNRYIAARTY